MHESLLEFIFIFGILQQGPKPPVYLKYRPDLEYRNFYHTVYTFYDLMDNERIIKRWEVESVEKLIEKKNPVIEIINRKAKLNPENQTEFDILLRRPYFDRLKQFELFGDFRSSTLPFGYKWMLFPSPESLMVPKEKFYEGQKWSVKMVGGAYEMNYELTNVDHEKHEAIIEGRNGICKNNEYGDKKWNASWIVDTRTGIFKEMQLKVDHDIKDLNQKTRLKMTKVWMRGEEDPDKRYDYQLTANPHPEL